MQYTYYMPTKILFGPGSRNRLHEEALPGKKALVVTTCGESVIKYGYLDRVLAELDRAGVEHVVFNKILQNPLYVHVMEGAAMADAAECDFVVGLGGGSPIDSAKAIAVMAANMEDDYWDYISGGTGKGQPVPNDPLPIVAITTTAGTGTEADPWTVITKGEEKIGFGYDKTFPTLSVVDPELMVSVPWKLTAFQGFDALFHSTEGYVNRTANPMSDLYAKRAIELVGQSLARAVKDGDDLEARGDVALANTLAGIVESTSGCISEHSIAHAMSAIFPHLEHGAALMMISKAYYTHLAKSGKCDVRMVDMARAMGRVDAGDPMDFVKCLDCLQRACGTVGLKMSDYGIKREDLPAIAENAMETMGGLYKVDPCEITLADTVAILEESYS